MTTALEAPTLAQKMESARAAKAAAARARYAEYLFRFESLSAAELSEMASAMAMANVSPADAESDRQELAAARAAISAGDEAAAALPALEKELERVEAKIEKAAGVWTAAGAALDKLIVEERQPMRDKIQSAKFAIQDRETKKFRLKNLFPA